MTNPQEGFWGIAVVLSERERTTEFYPMCHIAITPLVFQKEVELHELNLDELTPLVFQRNYTLEKQKRKSPNFEPFFKAETCIGIYTRNNKPNFKIIGNIDPTIVYDGPLPFDPLYGLKITFPLCGPVTTTLGREAYITWLRESGVK